MADESAPIQEAEQPAAPEAPAGTEAPAEAGTTEATEATAPDLNESLRQMNASLEELKSERKQPEVDPLDRLLGQEAPDDEYEYVDEPAQQQAPAQAPDPDEDIYNELQSVIDERVQSQITPIFQQQEQQRREVAIRALAEKYPDLTDHADQIHAMLAADAQRYGNQWILTDPIQVERAYKALKADAIGSAESPAAEAAGRGAVLEQGAGPGVPEGETDPVQEQYDRIFAGFEGPALNPRPPD